VAGFRPLVVLGVTGSIGLQTLDVADSLGVEVAGVAAGGASPRLARLLANRPHVDVALAREEGAADLARSVPNQVEVGPEAVASLAARPASTVVNGIVGAAGLAATLAALEAGNRVGLANKESMVTAGELVNATAAAGRGELIPVDSEHSALHQCMAGERRQDVARIVLTASGGPFRGRERETLRDVSAAEALAHPTWDMGGRISVDSATLVNKGLEVIEAHHLFGLDFDRIDVVVHPQSIVHSAVEFVDGSLKAHLGRPDMRIPIQYAITHPHRAPSLAEPFSLVGQTLDFEAPDRAAFPALDLAYVAGREGGSAPAVFNAADEVAVAAFLEGRIGFLDIETVLAATLEAVPGRRLTSFEEVVDVDAEARRTAASVIEDTVDRTGGEVG
jgi:1-deoxy-D-xylulose-5-phosphate reductoisomerase